MSIKVSKTKYFLLKKKKNNNNNNNEKKLDQIFID